MSEMTETLAKPVRTSRGPRPLPPKVANTFLAGGVSFAAAHALGLFGALSVLTFPLLVVGSIVAIGVGLHRNRPQVRWPWFAFLACTMLFVAGSAMRDIYPSLGVVGPERSLMPDLFAMPGYLLYGAALLGMLYYQRGGRGSAGSVIEASVLSLSGLLIAWAAALTPLMHNADATFTAKVAISAYAPVSLFLVAIAAKLAFVPNPSVVHRYLLGLVSSMLAGDLMYFLFELGLFDHKDLADGPYALASVFLAAAALHPSMASPPGNSLAAQRKVGARRLTLAGLAMFIPVGVLLVAPPVNGIERAGITAVSVTLVGLVVVRVLQALREQQRYEEELAYRADHDPLTGLPNRTYLLDQVNRMLREDSEPGRNVALMFLDVDQFKLINDSLGHLVGDQLLVSVAKHLQRIVRDGDLVARVSGDEFVIALPLTTVEEASRLAERVRASFEQPLPLGMSHTYLSVSIGLVFAEDDTTDALELIRDADTAMYRSKEAGRDQVTLFDDEMRTQVSRRVNLEGRLRNAVERGEMLVHYQPIISLPSGNVEGFEALMRWEPPGEKVFPDQFIPVAEESGLIVPLGEWILNEACEQLAEWRRQFPQAAAGMTMSVNLSVRQLREPDLVDVVAAALAASGLPGDALTLEITESVIMDDTEANIAKLVGLRNMGVRLSVDDFGTGFSSLSYLKKFPIDRVKIDRSFVSSLGDDASDAALVKAIIAMSAALDLDTIAEGIEEPHQAEILHQLGCSHAQGYMYARPVPPADIPGIVCQLGVVSSAASPATASATSAAPVMPAAAPTGAASATGTTP